MTCPKCGSNNNDNSIFCIKCGFNLKGLQQTESVNANYNQNEQNGNYQQQPIQNFVQQPASITNVSTAPLNYLMYIIAVLLKPLKSFKEEEEKLDNAKTSFVFTLIITVFMTIISLINIIFTTVHVQSYSWSSGYKYSWEWSNLKNVEWLEIIGKNLLMYAGIIFAIALVFYLGSLIIKKQLSFTKSLSISTTSIIPAVIGIMVLSPLVVKIWPPLSIVFIAVGAIYSLIILYELMNYKLKLEGDTKIYFILACLSVLIIASYYAFMKLSVNALISGF